MSRVSYLGLSLFCLLGWSGAQADASQVVGPDECGECHKHEVATWRETRHQKTFYELSRKDKAQEIADKMGVKRLKRDAVCTQCHFTMQQHEGDEKAIAGVSCESCHSAAKGWFEVHNDYGGKEVKAEQETAAHKRERLAKMDAAGMIRSDQIYTLAENCYQCHLVLDEKLVNVGGHEAGSKFELVAWSQGENRHNFYRSADGKQNVESSIERRRLMFVAGLALDLEWSLRGVAGASEKAKYAVTMAKRANNGIKKLEALNAKLDGAPLSAMIAAAKGAELRLGNGTNLKAAADKLRDATQAFLAANDGSALGGVDRYLPKPDSYKGTPGEAQE